MWKAATEKLQKQKKHWTFQTFTNKITINNELVYNLIKRFGNEKLIWKNIGDRLKINSPWKPWFYIQPKMQKEENPSRSAISSLNCDRIKISQYVDYYLQPIVKQILSYVKETGDFTSKLTAVETVPDE